MRLALSERRGSNRGDESFTTLRTLSIIAHDGGILTGLCCGIPLEILSSGNSSRMISLFPFTQLSLVLP